MASTNFLIDIYVPNLVTFMFIHNKIVLTYNKHNARPLF